NLQSSIFNLQFIIWLAFLVGFMALTVSDLRWKLLPNRIVYPLVALAAIQAVITAFGPAGDHWYQLMVAAWAALIGGGLFYILFQVSSGRWIGGGDVKLGFLLGLIVATPSKSLLMLLLASVFGTLVSLPLMARKRLTRHSQIPFGPFLILAAVIVQ